MSRTLSRLIGSTGLGAASRAVPRSMAAPLRSQGGPCASSTSIFSHAPPGGRASLARPAVDRNGRSPSGDKTTDGLEDPSAGAAAKGNPMFAVQIPPGTLNSGVLCVGKFLRSLGLDWKLADGAFVETGCPYFTFSEDKKEAEVNIPIFAFVDGCWCATDVQIAGEVRINTCCRGKPKPSAVFTMVGLTKPLADMGVEECEAVLLVVERDEDGRILGVGLMRVDPGAQGLENAAGPQPAAPEQVHEEAEEAPKAAATADPMVIKDSIVIVDGNGNLTVANVMNWLLAALAAAPPPAGGKKQGTRQMRQKAKKAAEPAAAPEPEPAATAKADAAETAVSSKTPRSGDNYTITNNITNNIGYLNQGNDLRENHLGLDEWRSGGW